jgi:SAM-dependent methyltransferase
MTALDDLLAMLSGWTPLADDAVTWRRLDGAIARLGEELTEAELPAAREKLHVYFLQAPCIARAWSKPRGYPGDSGIMDMGYRNLPEGATPLGRCLHQWFSLSRGGTAVRARRRWILQQMQRHGRHYPHRWRALSVAGGSAWELRDLVEESFLVRTAELTLLDQDPRALEDAVEGYETAAARVGRRAPLTVVRSDIRALLRGETTLPPQDFIYSLGLYDYLPERAARALTARLYDLLDPGGQLVVANYLPGGDAQPMLEILMDWTLVYRSTDALAALADGLDGAVEVVPDSTGTLAALVVTKPG